MYCMCINFYKHVYSGDSVRIGLCVPRGANWTLKMSYPLKLKTMSDFIQVDSLAELDKDEDGKNGKKYYFDAVSR